MKLNGNKILVTGGASGIGFGIASRFIQEGNEVIICGRRESALQAVREKHPEIIIRSCDLSVSEERIGLMDWIKREHPNLNVLVNNAGIQNWMSLDDPDFLEQSRKEIAINVEAPLHLTQLFATMPAAQTLLNVTSGLSFVPLIKVPVYSATKAFMHSFTLSTRALLKPKNIEVIEIIPPALNTDLGGKGIHDFAPPVADFINAIFEQMKAGKQEVSFGFSLNMLAAGPEEIKQAFARMNASEE